MMQTFNKFLEMAFTIFGIIVFILIIISFFVYLYGTLKELKKYLAVKRQEKERQNKKK